MRDGVVVYGWHQRGIGVDQVPRRRLLWSAQCVFGVSMVWCSLNISLPSRSVPFVSELMGGWGQNKHAHHAYATLISPLYEETGDPWSPNLWCDLIIIS